MLRSSIARVAIGLAVSVAHAAEPALDTQRIESITGLTGTYNQAENVFKVSKPRTDIKPTVDRWSLPAFMGIHLPTRSHASPSAWRFGEPAGWLEAAK